MGTLHVVATPIGNLADITLRALETLQKADLVLAEDTRRTRILLDRHEIRARPVSLHRHNEASRLEQALETLRSGGSVALVSDAGTPLVSDPGERLVAAAIAEGHRVESVPGASAVLAALASSGLVAVPFTFLGFAPRKPGALRRWIEPYLGRPETLVLFESPRRLGDTLRGLADVLGERRACVARELTKLHEELVRDSLSELAERYAGDAEVRGEITIVVEGAEESEALAQTMLSELEVDDRIRALLAEGRRPREIAAELAPHSTMPRRALYARVLALRAET